jgi:hypothetical protein
MDISELDAAKFWAKVDMYRPALPQHAAIGPCWIANSSGTGRRIGGLQHQTVCIGGKAAKAHRVAWALANGPIPDGAMICHHCDNPPCCNPAHLYAGNAQTNADDKVARGRCSIPKHLPPPAPSGADNLNAKLTEEQVIEILLLDEPYVHIAERYGVSRILVSLIKRGKAWKHIERPPVVSLRPMGRPPRAA